MAMVAPVAAEAAAGGAAEAGAAGAGGGGTLRPGAYKGGSSMAVDGHNRPPKPRPAAKAPAAAKAPTSKPAASSPDEPGQGPGDEQDRRRRWGLPNPGGAVREGSWVVLGFLGWVWVALPFIKSGPSGVGAVLAAKFLNRTADAHDQHAQHVTNKGTS